MTKEKRWGIIGLGNIFERTKNIFLNFPEIHIVAVCDLNEMALSNFEGDVYKTKDYTTLLNYCDVVVINTPPATHYQIANFFIRNGVDVIVEKPLTSNLEKLTEMEMLISNCEINFYSLLHYSFGQEILWWKEFGGKFGAPDKIISVFDDVYYAHQELTTHAIGLGGAYLDSTINSLSGIYKLFQGVLVPKSLEKIYDSKTNIDVFAKSKYEIEFDGKIIDIEVNIDWRTAEKRRGIYLYFKGKTIFLDGKNQCVVDLNSNKILFKADGISIDNHYKEMIKDCIALGDNRTFSFPLHRAILQNLELKK